MKTATIVMGIVLVALIGVALWRGGGSLQRGLTFGGKTFLSTLPLLVFAFAIAGLVQILVPREFILKWLGPEAGLKGILLGTVAGGFTPGGPYVSFPIVASLYKSGASVGTVVAFVTAWSVWAIARFPMEMGLVGPKLAIARFLSTLIVPPLAGLFAQAVFGRWL
ncbi:MAG TPA: permease [bacterium]|nr:permease [bacterium]